MFKIACCVLELLISLVDAVLAIASLTILSALLVLRCLRKSKLSACNLSVRLLHFVFSRLSRVHPLGRSLIDELQSLVSRLLEKRVEVVELAFQFLCGAFDFAGKRVSEIHLIWQAEEQRHLFQCIERLLDDLIEIQVALLCHARGLPWQHHLRNRVEVLARIRVETDNAKLKLALAAEQSLGLTRGKLLNQLPPGKAQHLSWFDARARWLRGCPGDGCLQSIRQAERRMPCERFVPARELGVVQSLEGPQEQRHHQIRNVQVCICCGRGRTCPLRRLCLLVVSFSPRTTVLLLRNLLRALQEQLIGDPNYSRAQLEDEFRHCGPVVLRLSRGDLPQLWRLTRPSEHGIEDSARLTDARPRFRLVARDVHEKLERRAHLAVRLRRARLERFVKRFVHVVFGRVVHRSFMKSRGDRHGHLHDVYEKVGLIEIDQLDVIDREAQRKVTEE